MSPSSKGIISAQPGPQTEFLRATADICIYGGAAGGGKTVGLLLEPLRHVSRVVNFTAVFFRRTTPQITNPGALWDESLGFYPRAGGTPHHGVHEWRWSNGSKIKFSHLQLENTVHDWQGAQIALICFDELTHFTSYQFFYMVSRNRSTCGVKPYIRATCNPDADNWVAEFLAWWIDRDTGYPIPERVGVLRYYLRVSDNIVWADQPDDLRQYMPRPEDLPRVSTRRGRSASHLSRPRWSTTPLCCGSTRTTLLGFCHCRCSSVSACSVAIGRSGRRPGSISSGSGVLSSTRSRQISKWSGTGILPPPKRLRSTTRIGRWGSSSAGIGTAAIGYWMWCASERTLATSSDCCSTPRPRTAHGFASGSARTRGRPARARRFTWYARSVASP